MILFILCVVYVFSAVMVYKDIRKTYWTFMIDDAPTSPGEWVIILLPIVNTLYLIYTEYIKYKNRKRINKN